MSKLSHLVLTVTIMMTVAGCNEVEPTPTPIAPILKDIVMPSEVNSLPGTNVVIAGKGFDTDDVIVCKSNDGEADFTPEVVAVDNYGITIAVPSNACGNYTVSVTRGELTTVLVEKLYVAYVILLDNIVLPSSVVMQGTQVEISAEGIESGDTVVFESTSYPDGVSVEVSGTYADNTLEITIPNTCYGVNVVKLVRGKRIGALGTINVGVELFAKTAGGIVFYTSDGGVHGLVVYESTLGDAAMNWGPAVPNSFAAATQNEVYTGKTNSAALMTQIANTKDTYTYSHKTPVELCDELTSTQNDISYNDWFLPSLDELVELFKVKATVAEHGFSVPANNYWSSTEYDYSGGWVWAMCYSNFYEATSVVTGCADRTGWAIGTLACRQF